MREPGRRFVTIKLFYVDETPDDYEPPLFKRAETDSDGWYLSTQSVSVIFLSRFGFGTW
jgi:meiosis-specific protein HOP1